MNFIPLQNGDMVEVMNLFSIPRHVGIYAEGCGFVASYITIQRAACVS